MLRGLHKLEMDGMLGGVNLVRGNGSAEMWEERMRGIVESSVSLESSLFLFFVSLHFVSLFRSFLSPLLVIFQLTQHLF